jgi:hypothetical protein
MRHRPEIFHSGLLRDGTRPAPCLRGPSPVKPAPDKGSWRARQRSALLSGARQLGARDESRLGPVKPIDNAWSTAHGAVAVITSIVFALAAVCVMEAVLALVLLGWAVAELGAFLRRHPDGAAGGLRRLATGARRVWPLLPGLAKASSQIAGRRVLRSRPGRWVLRTGLASAGSAYAAAVTRIRRNAPGSPRRRTGGPATSRPRAARRERARG